MTSSATQPNTTKLFTEWSDKYSLLKIELAKRAIEMPKNLTKTQYFELASQKLGLSQSQITELLCQAYNPAKLWYVICAMGVFAAVSLYIYNKQVSGNRQ